MKQRHEEYLELENVIVKRLTDKAILVLTEDDEEKWFPLSVCDWTRGDAVKPEVGAEGSLYVAESFAEKAGLA